MVDDNYLKMVDVVLGSLIEDNVVSLCFVMGFIIFCIYIGFR